MTDQGVVKTLFYWKTRNLADGTPKRYRSKKTYTIKGGVNDLRCRKNDEQLSSKEKVEVIVKYVSGVKIKRLCNDYSVPYAVIRRIIDANKPRGEK